MNKYSGCKHLNNHEFLLSKYEKATLKYFQRKQMQSTLKSKSEPVCPFCYSNSISLLVHGPSSLTLRNVSEKTNSMILARTPNKNLDHYCSSCKSYF